MIFQKVLLKTNDMIPYLLQILQDYPTIGELMTMIILLSIFVSIFVAAGVALCYICEKDYQERPDVYNRYRSRSTFPG